MCNLYSMTTNQAAIRDLFKVTGISVGNLPRMPGVFPDYLALWSANAGADRELTMMPWGMPPPPKFRGARHQHPQYRFAGLARLVEARKPASCPRE